MFCEPFSKHDTGTNSCLTQARVCASHGKGKLKILTNNVVSSMQKRLLKGPFATFTPIKFKIIIPCMAFKTREKNMLCVVRGREYANNTA